MAFEGLYPEKFRRGVGKQTFVGDDFEGLDFGGHDLTGFNLSGAKLKLCDLGKVSFCKALLDGLTDLKSSFIEADLREASAVGAIFQYTDFRYADFRGAKFSKCSFRDCVFGETNMANCQFIACDFTGAILQGSDLTNSDFTESMFIATRMDNSNLEGAILDFTQITDAHITLEQIEATLSHRGIIPSRLPDGSSIEPPRGETVKVSVDISPLLLADVRQVVNSRRRTLSNFVSYALGKTIVEEGLIKSD